MANGNPILSKAESYDVALEHKNRFIGKSKAPYSHDVAKSRASIRLRKALSTVETLPKKAFPSNKMVTEVTLHPSYLAKSSYPEKLFKAYDLKNLGSKEVFIETDSKVNKSQEKGAVSSSSYYISGEVSRFNQFLRDLSTDNIDEFLLDEVVKIEDLSCISGELKLSPSINPQETNCLRTYEVVMHASIYDQDIIDGFFDYIEDLGGELFRDKTRTIKGLSFCFVSLESSKIQMLAEYSFVRVVRPVSGFKSPDVGMVQSNSIVETAFAHFEPKGKHANIAIFDGGILPDSLDNQNIRYFDLTNQSLDLTSNLQHGTLVTSAVVYGDAEEFQKSSQPILNVDHYKVYSQSDAHSILMVDVLDRIVRVLTDIEYKFVNISLGPEIPCDDGQPNLWTATLDELASNGKTLIVVAAGNSGEEDECFRRIQPPADILNGISVGAADSKHNEWARADYSSIGPGKKPGFIKPDLVQFAGCSKSGGDKLSLFSFGDFDIHSVYGTSYAAPLVLRKAALIDRYTHGALDVATIRALLVHSSDNQDLCRKEIGWGRLTADPQDILHCSNQKVTVIYQGKLEKLSGIQAVIPWPEGLAESHENVKVSATICYYTEVDQHHSVSYSKSGLEIVFRPDESCFSVVKGKKSSVPKTEPFFSQKKVFDGSDTHRTKGHLWETCLSSQISLKASKLNKPVFDIKYLIRDEGHTISSYERRNLKPLSYSLVVTLELEGSANVYDAIRTKFSQILPIELQVDAIVRV